MSFHDLMESDVQNVLLNTEEFAQSVVVSRPDDEAFPKTLPAVISDYNAQRSDFDDGRGYMYFCNATFQLSEYDPVCDVDKVTFESNTWNVLAILDRDMNAVRVGLMRYEHQEKTKKDARIARGDSNRFFK